MIKHSQYIQSNKYPISLQYLKTEVRNGVYFLHADKHQSVYKRDYFFDGSDHICPKYQKKEVGGIFAKKFKSVAAAFMFHFDAKYLDILWRCSHVYCYLFPCTDRLLKFSASTLQYNN